MRKVKERVTSKHMEMECITSKVEDGKCWILKLNPKKIGKEGKDKGRTK